MRSRRPSALLALVLLTGVATLTGATSANFLSQTASTGNRVSAAPDFRAPSASGAIVFKSQTPGSTTGYTRQGGSYRIYANVSDTGTPPAGRRPSPRTSAPSARARPPRR